MAIPGQSVEKKEQMPEFDQLISHISPGAQTLVMGALQIQA